MDNNNTCFKVGTALSILLVFWNFSTVVICPFFETNLFLKIVIVLIAVLPITTNTINYTKKNKTNGYIQILDIF